MAASLYLALLPLVLLNLLPTLAHRPSRKPKATGQVQKRWLVAPQMQGAPFKAFFAEKRPQHASSPSGGLGLSEAQADNLAFTEFPRLNAYGVTVAQLTEMRKALAGEPPHGLGLPYDSSFFLRDLLLLCFLNVKPKEVGDIYESIMADGRIGMAKKVTGTGQFANDMKAKAIDLAKKGVKRDTLVGIWKFLTDDSGLSMPWKVAIDKLWPLAQAFAYVPDMKNIWTALKNDRTVKALNLTDLMKDATIGAGHAGAIGLAFQSTFKACRLKDSTVSTSSKKQLDDCVNQAVFAGIKGSTSEEISVKPSRHSSKDSKVEAARSVNEFKADFKDQWLVQWLAAPMQEKLVPPLGAYNIARFRDEYTSIKKTAGLTAESWASAWQNLKEVMQVRADTTSHCPRSMVAFMAAQVKAGDGPVWAQKWAEADRWPCQECVAAGRPSPFSSDFSRKFDLCRWPEVYDASPKVTAAEEVDEGGGTPGESVTNPQSAKRSKAWTYSGSGICAILALSLPFIH